MLENKVNQLEAKVDDYEQEAKLDSLLFNGLKQNPSQNLNPAINHILDQMGLSSIANSDIVSVHWFCLGSINSQRPDKVAPVLVKFRSKDIASTVFKVKKNLANSRIFVSENLTKKKCKLLNVARDKFGNRCVWSDQGRDFVHFSLVIVPFSVFGISMIFYNISDSDNGFRFCSFFFLSCWSLLCLLFFPCPSSVSFLTVKCGLYYIMNGCSSK